MNITKEEYKQAAIGTLKFSLSLIPPVLFILAFSYVMADTLNAQMAAVSLTFVIWAYSYYHILEYTR